MTADAITNASSQQELRLSELVRASHQIQEGVAIQSAQSANATEKIIDTLDNIQRGRVPADIEYKPGTVKKSDQ